MGHAVLPVYGFGNRLDLVLDELAHHAAEELIFFGETKVHRQPSLCKRIHQPTVPRTLPATPGKIQPGPFLHEQRALLMHYNRIPAKRQTASRLQPGGRHERAWRGTGDGAGNAPTHPDQVASQETLPEGWAVGRLWNPANIFSGDQRRREEPVSKKT